MKSSRTSFATAAFFFAGLVTPAWPQVEEAVYNWRFDDDGKREIVSLFRADSNATEPLSSFLFSCKRHSGKVTVSMALQDDDRIDIGNLIKTNGYPKFLLLPEASGDHAKIEMNDAEGWTLSFEIDAPSKFFSSFARTGEIRYQLVNAVHNWGIGAGKEVIPNFVKACRRRE